MSKMGQISMEIQEMLEQGRHPVVISKILQVPLTWVYDTLESMNPYSEEYDPYNTVNS